MVDLYVKMLESFRCSRAILPFKCVLQRHCEISGIALCIIGTLEGVHLKSIGILGWVQSYSMPKNVDPVEIFLTSKVTYFLRDSTHKTEAGTANRWEITNSKPPVPNIMIDESETGSSSQIIFVTIFMRGALNLHERSSRVHWCGVCGLKS